MASECAQDGAGDVGGWSGGKLERQCRGEGPLDAKIWIIGEAPGEAEVSHKRPFFGASGYQLDQLIKASGLSRGAMRVENVVERRPPQNKIEAVPKDELAAWVNDLGRRLALAGPQTVLVPLGGTALGAVMGPRHASIMKYRGTVLTHATSGCSVLPSVHPAAVLRQPSLTRRCLVDWGRVAKLAQGINVAAPHRDLLVAGLDISWEQAWDELTEAAAQGRPISIDIETLPEQRKITCVGFATSATRAITLSTWYPDYRSGLVQGVLEDAKELIRAVVESQCPKIFQNGVGYDTPWLREVGGATLRGRVFDTRWMHHSMYPSDGGDDYAGRGGFVGEDHGLAYLASIYTAEAYWKDEAKSADRRTQLRYNGKDCAVTYEVWERLSEELVATGRWDYYCESYESLYPILGDPDHLGGGLRIDLAARKAKLDVLARKAGALANGLDALAGVDTDKIAALVGATSAGQRGKDAAAARKELKALKAKSIFGDGGGVSYTKVTKFLEETCQVRLPKKRGATGKATDEVTLRQVYLKSRAGSPASIAVPLLLDYRSTTKQGTFLAEKNYDSDGRVRCTYTMLPETGRLSSQGSAFGTGMNLQNIMQEVRDVFTADEGQVLVEVDLSTAEDRVVKMLTRDPAMMKLARTMPWELDQHTYNASILYGKPEAQVTKEDRQVIKRTAHACNYDMGPARMSEQWLKDSEGEMVRTPVECARLQALYVERCMPQLPQYHADIRMQIMRHKCLSNPFGRILDLSYERLDHDTYKRGYAFLPQSTVGMLVNRYGLVPLWKWLQSAEGRATGARICLQLHDALYLSTPPKFVHIIASKVQELLERPVVYYGQPMTIPCCFSVSRRWGGKEKREWKRLPVADEMIEFAASLV